jgi:hypothetical protein
MTGAGILPTRGEVAAAQRLTEGGIGTARRCVVESPLHRLRRFPSPRVGRI